MTPRPNCSSHALLQAPRRGTARIPPTAPTTAGEGVAAKDEKKGEYGGSHGQRQDHALAPSIAWLAHPASIRLRRVSTRRSATSARHTGWDDEVFGMSLRVEREERRYFKERRSKDQSIRVHHRGYGWGVREWHHTGFPRRGWIPVPKK